MRDAGLQLGSANFTRISGCTPQGDSRHAGEVRGLDFLANSTISSNTAGS